MSNKRAGFLLICFTLLLVVVISSCQKDTDVKDPGTSVTNVNADSSLVSSPGNFLAATGTLTIKFNDSTYTFDAARDSIAFINVGADAGDHYFGITAINKAHTMSFGISSSGYVYSNINTKVAGGQFLLSTDGKKPAMQLSLSKYPGQKDFGSINMITYNQNNVLAKGAFYTFLAKDDHADSPYYRVEGSFDLKVK